MQLKIKYTPEFFMYLQKCLERPEYTMIWYFDECQVQIQDLVLRKDDIYLYIHLTSYVVSTLPYSLPRLLRWKTWWGIKVVSDKGELLSEYQLNYGKGHKRGFIKRLIARFQWWSL